MKKIIASFFLFFIIGSSCFSDFDGSYTQITNTQIFQKKSGMSELKVSEDYFINPFSSAEIKKNTTICTGNACSCGISGCSYITGYSINGSLFNSQHPLYQKSGNIIKNWHVYQEGIDATIEYRENTYVEENGVLTPNQNVKVRRYFIATYKHDTTAPTCGEVNYYNDEELTQSFTYSGGWLNKPKYFTMTCLDSETGCYCALDDQSCIMKDEEVISTAQLLGHNIKPTVSFTNKVKLTDVSCQPGGAFRKVLFDLKIPKIDIALGGEDFNLNLEPLRVYKNQAGKKMDGIEIPGELEFTRSGSINQIVGNTSIDINIEDSFLEGSVHGVSGLKDYDFSIERMTDSSFRSITTESLSTCKESKNFTNEYNKNGDIEASDIDSITIICNELLKAGKYNFTFIVHDWAGNKIKVSSFVNLYPDVISLTQSNLISSSNSNVYANNIDTYEYDIILKDQYNNPIFDTIISKPQQSIESYSLGKELLLLNNNSALNYIYPTDNKTNLDGIYHFTIKSAQPGEYTERFKFNLKAWNEKYIQNGLEQDLFITNNLENTFLKPFSANISIEGGETPELGTDQNYTVNMSHNGGISSISGGRLYVSKENLNFSTSHSFDSLNVSDNRFSTIDNICTFNGTFNADDEGSVLEGAVLDIDNMDVSYTLGGQYIRYTLDRFGLSGCDISILGLKTIGAIQGDGKGAITGGNENFSDVSTSIFRTQIRQNAYNLIKGMSSGDIINGVKYVQGDVNISGNQNYETLIVHNGNIFISGDLNPSENILGLIVLTDEGFNIDFDYDNIGNIYIGKDVENIHANLYTDGTLRSADESGNEYNDSELFKKLYLKGGIFTRNTVGGAVTAGSDYILPGGSKTNNDTLARIYDLNYIRRAQVCGEVDDYSFLVEYDPRIQSTPPKGFSLQ